MPINIIAKSVPAIAIVCSFILIFYYGEARAVIGGFVPQVLWLFPFGRR